VQWSIRGALSLELQRYTVFIRIMNWLVARGCQHDEDWFCRNVTVGPWNKCLFLYHTPFCDRVEFLHGAERTWLWGRGLKPPIADLTAICTKCHMWTCVGCPISDWYNEHSLDGYPTSDLP